MICLLVKINPPTSWSAGPSYKFDNRKNLNFGKLNLMSVIKNPDLWTEILNKKQLLPDLKF